MKENRFQFKKSCFWVENDTKNEQRTDLRKECSDQKLQYPQAKMEYLRIFLRSSVWRIFVRGVDLEMRNGFAIQKNPHEEEKIVKGQRKAKTPLTSNCIAISRM